MRLRHSPRLLLLLGASALGVLLITSATAKLRAPSTPMVQAAKHFLTSLTPEQAAKVQIKFDDDERLNWHFIPKERKGLTLREMTPPQKHLAHALLSTALSSEGYMKATTIMSLEDVLRILENDSGERRNPEKYHFSIFGEPSETGTWGYRVEGHHMSINVTLTNGRIAGSPMFFGANPAEVRQGPRAGLRVLASEEDAARALYEALDAEQRKVALIDAKAYPDILTMASRKVELTWKPNGLPMARMNAKQREMLTGLLDVYCDNMPAAVAQHRREQIKKAGNDVRFAWTGVAEKGGPHYYRVQGPAFLIEYDNTQNNANHVHAVWRDLEGDFGMDLLKQHYQSTAHAGR